MSLVIGRYNGYEKARAEDGSHATSIESQSVPNRNVLVKHIDRAGLVVRQNPRHLMVSLGHIRQRSENIMLCYHARIETSI